MKSIRKIAVTCVLALTMIASSSTVLAVDVDTSCPLALPSQSETVQPKIYFNNTVNLPINVWSNITSSNNLLNDAPLVTSDINNPSIVSIRVVNAKGEIVGKVKWVKPGSSVRLDTIPASSGVYTIQGCPSKSGIFRFVID